MPSRETFPSVGHELPTYLGIDYESKTNQIPASLPAYLGK